jgi:hypothetical protein
MMNIELIYFRECPNISPARERLLQAFATTGITPQWQEWERNDPAGPAYARAYGSPAILVNGRDVSGAKPAGDEVSACRVYAHAPGIFDGAPAVDSIVKALREAQADAPAHTLASQGRSAATVLPAIGVAALPKLTCPACWPAYTGLLSSMGAGFVNYTPYLLPLTATFLFLSLCALGWRAPRHRGYGPLFLGLAASAMLLVGKFAFDSNTAMYSLWNAWPRAGQAAGNCPECVSTPSKL